MKDPFEGTDVRTRRAILVTLIALGVLAIYGINDPQLFVVVGVILALPVIIMLHEFAHYITAKRSGMKVTEFFVGFGPRIWSITRGETEYGIKAIPLGGYCRIIGMTNLEEVPEPDEPRAYRNKPYLSRVLVAGAGSAMHFLIAIVLMFAVLAVSGKDFRNARLTTTLGGVEAGAKSAGLQAGDRLVAVDGTKLTEWTDVTPIVRKHEIGDTIPLTVERDGHLLTKNVTLSPNPQLTTAPMAGISPSLHTPSVSLGAALVKAPVQVVGIGRDSVTALGSIFSPSGISQYIHTVGGETKNDNQRFLSPVGFAKVANDAVRSGWVNTMSLLIAINVFVGLFNLVPLLPFDGGHIAIATYERIASSIRRRRVQVDVAKLLPITVVVVGILGFIFLSSLFLDISRPIANPF